MFKSLRQFECIFVHDVRVCSSSTDFRVAVPFSQYHLLKKDCHFPILYSCLLCQRLFDRRCLSLFLDSLFFSIGAYVIFVPVPHCLDYCSFAVFSEVWESYASCLFPPTPTPPPPPGLLCQFWIFYGSVYIVGLFVPVL